MKVIYSFLLVVFVMLMRPTNIEVKYDSGVGAEHVRRGGGEHKGGHSSESSSEENGSGGSNGPSGSNCTCNSQCSSGACDPVTHTCACKAVFQACNVTSECCYGNCVIGCDGYKVCACHRNNDACANNTDCCRGICIQSKCACTEVTGACTTDRDCCTGICDPKIKQCRCLGGGESCADSSQCCRSKCDNGVCNDCEPLYNFIDGNCSESNCCIGKCEKLGSDNQYCGCFGIDEGHPFDGADCCSRYYEEDSSNGVVTCKCIDLGAECKEDANCCKGRCKSFCGKKICCCAKPGETCNRKEDCCGGTCLYGRCGCYPMGYGCSNSDECCNGKTCNNNKCEENV